MATINHVKFALNESFTAGVQRITLVGVDLQVNDTVEISSADGSLYWSGSVIAVFENTDGSEVLIEVTRGLGSGPAPASPFPPSLFTLSFVVSSVPPNRTLFPSTINFENVNVYNIP
jgi:hypothetical protein